MLEHARRRPQALTARAAVANHLEHQRVLTEAEAVDRVFANLLVPPVQQRPRGTIRIKPSPPVAVERLEVAAQPWIVARAVARVDAEKDDPASRLAAHE